MNRNLAARLVAAASLCLALLAGCSIPPSPASPSASVAPTPTPSPTAQPLPAPTPQTDALPDAYARILAQYAEAMANNYYLDLEDVDREAAFGADVALEWRMRFTPPVPAQYALSDLDGNGVPELLISAPEEEDGYTLYDVFTLEQDRAVRPFEFSFGYRTNLRILADRSLIISWSSSAFESGVDVYRYADASLSRLTAYTALADEQDPYTLLYYRDGEPLDEEAYLSALQALDSPGPMAFDWISAADAA